MPRLASIFLGALLVAGNPAPTRAEDQPPAIPIAPGASEKLDCSDMAGTVRFGSFTLPYMSFLGWHRKGSEGYLYCINGNERRERHFVCTTTLHKRLESKKKIAYFDCKATT